MRLYVELTRLRAVQLEIVCMSTDGVWVRGAFPGRPFPGRPPKPIMNVSEVRRGSDRTGSYRKDQGWPVDEVPYARVAPVS